jgi:hypothetical protein
MVVQEPPAVRRSLIPFDPEDSDAQLLRGRATKSLLDAWSADDSGYEESSWQDLNVALDRERRRVNARPLFPCE